MPAVTLSPTPCTRAFSADLAAVLPAAAFSLLMTGRAPAPDQHRGGGAPRPGHRGRRAAPPAARLPFQLAPRGRHLNTDAVTYPRVSHRETAQHSASHRSTTWPTPGRPQVGPAHARMCGTARVAKPRRHRRRTTDIIRRMMWGLTAFCWCLKASGTVGVVQLLRTRTCSAELPTRGCAYVIANANVHNLRAVGIPSDSRIRLTGHVHVNVYAIQSCAQQGGHRAQPGTASCDSEC